MSQTQMKFLSHQEKAYRMFVIMTKNFSSIHDIGVLKVVLTKKQMRMPHITQENPTEQTHPEGHQRKVDNQRR